MIKLQKKYKNLFSPFHTIYRLTTTSTNLQNFLIGISRLYRTTFAADKVIIICKSIASPGFLKIRLHENQQSLKKCGKSLLTKIEKEILSQGKEIMLKNRMIYPLIFSETMGGIYIKRSQNLEDFNEIDRKLFLSMSEEASISLKILSLYWENQKTTVNYIKSLSSILDQFVPTSYLHIKCTNKLLRAMAKELNLSHQETEALEYASLLHDTGKIHLPSKLLSKQKPLTDEEYKIVRNHPEKGVALLKDLNSLKPAIPIILHHHERYDGTGYPSKLKGEQIPLGARILSIVDAFDAMYFGRPYKKSQALSAIETELRAQMGKQFDPKITETFLKILHRADIKKHLHSLDK
jgi:HD-GYP domain-containing protein (c-di-GMP phosphodiesterase class II)